MSFLMAETYDLDLKKTFSVQDLPEIEGWEFSGHDALTEFTEKSLQVKKTKQQEVWFILLKMLKEFKRFL